MLPSIAHSHPVVVPDGQVFPTLLPLQLDVASLAVMHRERAPLSSRSSAIRPEPVPHSVDPDEFLRLQALDLHLILALLLHVKLGKIASPSSGQQPVTILLDANRFEITERVLVTVLNHHGVAQLELVAMAEVTTAPSSSLVSALSVPPNLEFAEIAASSRSQSRLRSERQIFPRFGPLQLDNAVLTVVDLESAPWSLRTARVHRAIPFNAQIFAAFRALEIDVVLTVALRVPLSKVALPAIMSHLVVVIPLHADRLEVGEVSLATMLDHHRIVHLELVWSVERHGVLQSFEM